MDHACCPSLNWCLDYAQATEPFEQKQKGSETRPDTSDIEAIKPMCGAF
jgi:hypothetical protein